MLFSTTDESEDKMKEERCFGVKTVLYPVRKEVQVISKSKSEWLEWKKKKSTWEI